jgi:hypothetical protein
LKFLKFFSVEAGLRTAVNGDIHIGLKLKTKLRGFSANYIGCLSAKLPPSFADEGCRFVSVTNPHGRNLHRSAVFFSFK